MRFNIFALFKKSSPVDIMLGIIVVLIVTAFFAASWKFAKNANYSWAIILVVLAGCILRCFISTDPFLHAWDERYHALVAKNLINHPLLPTLYENPVLSFDYKMWAGNHVWVHKQPVTLWGIALSVKMFGTSAFAVRIPSILLSGAGIYVTYLTGKKLFRPRVGYFAASFFAINGLILELTGGRMATDHVDIFFMFFVGLAVLAAISFAQTQKFWWNLLCGVSIGLAILCKWLPALIVLPIWLAMMLQYKWAFKRLFWHGLVLVGVVVAVALPWQWYIHTYFPVEAAWESKYNVLHLFQDLEHTGKPFYYYLDVMRVSYGELVYVPLIWGIVRAVRLKNDGRLWGILIWAIVPYVFFSFSATKLQGYTLFASGALFLITALFIDGLLENNIQVKYKWLKYTMLILLLAFPIRYSLERMKPFQQAVEVPQWQADIHEFSKRIEGNKKVVIFNTEHPIEFMFHTDAVAYQGIPVRSTLDSLVGKGYEIYIVKEANSPERWEAQ